MIALNLSIEHGTREGLWAQIETAVRGWAPDGKWTVDSCQVKLNPNLERRSYTGSGYVADVVVFVARPSAP